MNKIVKARVCWISQQEGGRKVPPIGCKYSTVAYFDDNKEKWPKGAWSIVLENISGGDELNCVIADLRFLVESGPVEFLHPGSIFHLYEGRRKVASGEVIQK